MPLTAFLCENGICDYDKTIQTEYNNYSVAALDENLYFLGIPPFGHEQDQIYTAHDLIHKIDSEGTNVLSFLPVYSFRAPVVREVMHSGGYIRIFPELNTIIVTFDFFPYIYLFDLDGELKTKHELSEFRQNYYRFEDKGAGLYSGRLLYDSNSRITYTSKIDDNYLLIRIREQRDVEFISLTEGFVGEEWHSYYVFDVSEEKLYKIGDDIRTTVHESRVIHVVDQGIIINEEGTLHFVHI